MKASVIIAARNAERTIKRAILSATAQSLSDLEVIVVDDGSSDRTAAEVAGLAQANSRIEMIRHPLSKGVSAARSAAIFTAKGEWLAIFNADDWFSHDRLSPTGERGLDVIIDNLDRVDTLTGLSLGNAFPDEWMAPSRPVSMSFLLEQDIPYRHEITWLLQTIIYPTALHLSGRPL